jgi:hypothetical protein
VLDRVEDAQAGVTGVARQQDHLDRRHVAGQLVETQQFLHQRERDARLEDLVLMIDLEASIRIQPITLEQRVTIAEVEQRARGNRHYQAVVVGGVGVMDVGRRADHERSV